MPPRAAAAAAADRLGGGSGAPPLRPDGIGQDVGFRVRQAAYDVLCAVHDLSDPAPLLADWGLATSQMNAIARVARELAGNDATHAREVILASKLERFEAAVIARERHHTMTSNSTYAPTPAASLDTPIKIGATTYLKSSISAASDDERRKLATKWATIRWSQIKKNSSLRLTSSDVHDEAVALFGDGVVPSESRIRELVNEGKVGTSPKKRGQPKVVSDSLNSKMVEFVTLLRAHKIPVYKHSVLLYLTTLADGTPLADRLKKNGDWDFTKLNHWYYRYFLKMDGASVGEQRPLDIARDRWQTAKNAKVFYDHAKIELLEAAIAVENPAHTPFEILPKHLSMSEAQFKKCVYDHPPEVTYVSSKAHLALSLDELKLQLATHDDNHRVCERTVRVGPDDDGETIAAKSNCSMSGIGGSHANFEPNHPGFVFATDSMDPAWVRNAPRVVINGKRFDMPFNEANAKGSFNAQMFTKYLSYLAEIRNEGDVIVLFLDGVQSHLTPHVLQFCAANSIKLVPRPPNTSDKIQNEDLWTFWIFRNHSELGYNKQKQTRFRWILKHTNRFSLNYSDAMEVVTPGWTNAMSPENNQIAWRKGGLRPFTRLPEMLFRWQEMKHSARREKRLAEAASAPESSVMPAEAQLKWNSLMDLAPIKRGRQDDLDDDEDEEKEEDGALACTGRMGAAAYFNTHRNMKGHASSFHEEIKDIKGMGKPELEAYIADVKKDKDPDWPVEYQTKNQATLDLIEWNAHFWGFQVSRALLGKKELIALYDERNGDVAEGGGGVEPAKRADVRPSPEKSRFWRREQADRSFPQGVAHIAAVTAKTATATTTATAPTPAPAPAPAPEPAPHRAPPPPLAARVTRVSARR